VKADGGAVDSATQMITLAVRTRDAGKIINALEFGKVWLTKQNKDTASGHGGSISRDDVTE
jgi:pilus assembly protein CpaB